MVRIWVASLHQKTSTYESTLRFLFCYKVRLTGRVDSNSIGPPNGPAGKKAPVQQRRPLPAAEAGRSCWGCGQQDARAAQGTTQPLGAATRVPFYFARLAISTRAHQEIAPRNVGFWVLFFCYNPLSNPLFQKTIQKATEKMSFCVTFMLSPPRCTAFPETAPRWEHRSAGSLPAAAHRQGL